MPLPPVAARRAHWVRCAHGAREDPYYWLRDDSRSDADVLAYLRAETDYADSQLARCGALIHTLHAEMVARLKKDDSSVPVRYRGYWYWTRFVEGGEYPLLLRREDREGAEDRVLLDCNELARGHAYFQLGSHEVSPDNRLLAYTEDVVGRRQYRLRVKDLLTGELLADSVENIEPALAWAEDNRTLLYVEKHPVTLIGWRVRAHRLGTDAMADTLVYEESDDAFDLTVARSKSERLLFIGAESTTASEWRFADVEDPERFRVFLPREANHEYQIDHLDDHFVVRTNWRAENFRIMVAPIEGCDDRACWSEVVPHDPDVFVHEFDVFRRFVAIGERSGGLLKIRVQPWQGTAFHIVADDPAYTMRLGANPELETTRLRYLYSSLTTPTTTFEQDVATGERWLLKQEPVLGDFDSSRYASEFIFVEARDRVRVPVSIVYRKDVPRDGSAPLYLYGYGSYGLCMDPAFGSARLSLLDRGFVCAIAHVRGGQELGRRWYDAGRLLNKWNTFNDFIDVTDALVARGYAASDKVFAAGGSAGGLLMGVIANVAPQKYAGLVAHVPFVDIVTTMLDESIPLTTLEYEEWGNPNEREFYEYMLSYSPYDNVKAQRYPPMLVTTGLWDSQVQYYEPAKWIAKLRALKIGDSPLLLHVNMDAGHGGKSGRYEHLIEVAREYGFFIALARGDFARPARGADGVLERTDSI